MKRRLSEASSSTTKRHATGLGRIQGEDFGQRTPPIHEIIRNILQEYPSGQIFKVNTDNFPASSAACSIYERSYSHNITDKRLGNRHGIVWQARLGMGLADCPIVKLSSYDQCQRLYSMQLLCVT